MKKWFLYGRRSFIPHPSASELMVEFANRHKLAPGELILMKRIMDIDQKGMDAIEFMYYAEHELD